LLIAVSISLNPIIFYSIIRKVGNTITSTTEVKNTFYSNVKQFRYQGKGSKKIVEYEISCQYRVVSEKVNKEIVYKWSVWKRYSHFFELHNQLLRALGWQMDGIVFPSGYVFVFNKLSPTFVEQRRYYIYTSYTT